MPMFRKKPVEIEAVQIKATDFNGESWDGSPFSHAPLPLWLTEALLTTKIRPVVEGGRDYCHWKIDTLEGEMTAVPGDWIIQGVKGELYPCKPDIFAATYEPVEGK